VEGLSLIFCGTSAGPQMPSYLEAVSNSATTRTSLKLATYNIKGLKIDREAVVQVLRDIDADVVAIQEVPRWLRQRSRFETMARDAGMRIMVHGGYPRGGVTTALLVRPEIASRVRTRGYKVMPLDPWRWFAVWRHSFILPSRRGFSFIDLGDYVVFSVHLGLSAAERAVHRNILLNYVDAHGHERAVVTGDINETPDGDSWHSLGRRLRDALTCVTSNDTSAEYFTFSATRPGRRIDAVFVGSNIRVFDVHVPHTDATARASDHLPIVAELG